MSSRASTRGFSLLTVILIVALLAMSITILLRMLEMEHQLARMQRLSREAVALADNGARHVMADRITELPLDELEVNYDVAGDDPLISEDRDYTAKVRLLRMDSIRETSMTSLKALIFEVSSVGSVRDGESVGEVAVEAYRVVGFPQGTVLKEEHFR